MQSIIPLLKYQAAPDAIAWICQHLGFELRLSVPEGATEIAHAQLQRGQCIVMVSSTRSNEIGLVSPAKCGAASVVIYVVEPELDQLFARLSSAGLDIQGSLQRDEHGVGRFQLRDIEGHIWSFSDYDPFAGDEMPE
jgi:uncharacterized glyoxalase superfamily protein PhnB